MFIVLKPYFATFHFMTTMRFLFVLVLIPINVFSQQIIQKTFVGDYTDAGLTITSTFDQNCLIGGFTTSFPPFNGKDAMLIKADAFGNIVWTKVFTNNFLGTDIGSIIPLEDSSIILFGRDLSYAFKLDQQDNLIWSRVYLNSLAALRIYKAVKNNDGGFLLIGESSSLTSDSIFASITKIDSFGNFQWSKKYSLRQYSFGNSIVRNENQNLFIIGNTANDSVPIVDYDVFLLEIDSAGNPMWCKTYSSPKQDYASNLYLDADRKIIIGGSVEGAAQIDRQAFLIKTDTTGNIIWSKTYRGAGPVECSQMLISEDNYLLSGFTVFQGYSDAILIKTDTAGNLLTFQPFGTGTPDYINFMTWGGDSSLLLTGYHSDASFLGGDVLFCKTDTLLNLGCTYNDPNASSSLVNLSTSAQQVLVEDVLLTDSTFTLTEALVTLGDTTICRTATTIISNNNEQDIKIFPNPFSDYFNLVFFDKMVGKDAMLEILNYTGQKQKQVKIESTEKIVTISTHDLPSGIYLCNVLFENQVKYSFKIICISP